MSFFDMQQPGLVELILFPAVVACLVGLLLYRRLSLAVAGPVAALVPGGLLFVLTLIEERASVASAPADLLWLPVGWMIWTMLSLPGVLIGVLFQIVLSRVQRLHRTEEAE